MLGALRAVRPTPFPFPRDVSHGPPQAHCKPPAAYRAPPRLAVRWADFLPNVSSRRLNVNRVLAPTLNVNRVLTVSAP